MPGIDPITVATAWHFMQRVCREMRETVERTASHPLAATLHDIAYGIWDAKGRIVAIPEGFPVRLISATFPIKAVIKKYGQRIYPGDVFLTNHPDLAGCVHLPDWVFIRPIFYEEELVFFTCMGTHVPDTGGAQAGAYYLASDSIAEGLNIPPIKITDRGRMVEDVIDLILTNNRLPDTMRREIASLSGSTAVAERRLVELLGRYGKETVFAIIEEMINRTEKAVRAEIAKWPEGTYSSQAQTDDDGSNLGIPVTFRCKLTIKGGEATFDFSESDDQVRGYVNTKYPIVLSDTLCTSFLFFDTALAAYHNEGSLRPFHVITRKGSVADSNPGALVAAAPSHGGTMIIECILSALSQALPHHAVTPYSRVIIIMCTGIDPRTNHFYVGISFNPDGPAGAVYGYDGYQCCTEMGALGVAGKADIEEEMLRFPWRMIRYEYITDSHGAGTWRGAPGIVWECVNEGPESAFIGGVTDGFRTHGQGQQGGCPTPFNKAYFLRGGKPIDIQYTHQIHQWKTGDSLVTESGGGAGVGPPEKRDPEAVRLDIKNELVSVAMARDIYKVVVNPDTLEIDHDATQRIRSKHYVNKGKETYP